MDFLAKTLRTYLAQIALAMTVLGFSLSLCAHPFDLGLLHATVSNNNIQVRLQMDKKAVSEIVGLRPDSLQESNIQKEKDLVFMATLGEAKIKTEDGADCDWQVPALAMADSKVTLQVSATCLKPVTEWSLQFPFLKHAPNTFEIVAEINQDQHQIELTANLRKPNIVISLTPQSSSWIQFLQMGIKHIGAVPSEWHTENNFHFPEGIDHILFVVALVLAGGGFIAILKTVTGFTVGHSLTLALATWGVVQIPSRWVESAIALSICIVALESLFSKKANRRWPIAFIFGLVHGLGFASALKELNLSGAALLQALIGFNLGVELGQCVIVLIVLPFLFILQRQSFTKKYAVPGLAWIIFGIGLVWFVQRAFALGS